MQRAIQPVRRYMTSMPRTIGVEQTVATAAAIMRDEDIRHLPVLQGSALVGLLSERDVALVEALDGVDPALIRVEDAMTPIAWAPGPETPVDEVAGTMAERKYGAAVIVQHDKVVGIFTTVDACRTLRDVLQTARGGAAPSP